MANSSSSAAPERVILDTDPGIDDAIAILLCLASPEIALEGLTIVFGNSADVDMLGRNARAILRLAGADARVPVCLGARQPLAGTFVGRREALGVHGANALGGVTLPDAPADAQSRPSAAEFIVERCRRAPGEMTVVLIGPQTNLALALALCPELPTLVRRVVVMGGSFREGGNITAAAEANVCNDPLAAQLVGRAPWRALTVVPLDVTHRMRITREHLASFGQLATPVCRFVAAIGTACCRLLGSEHINLHDPAAVLFLFRPDLFAPARALSIAIEARDGVTRGVTLADMRRRGNAATFALSELTQGEQEQEQEQDGDWHVAHVLLDVRDAAANDEAVALIESRLSSLAEQ